MTMTIIDVSDKFHNPVNEFDLLVWFSELMMRNKPA